MPGHPPRSIATHRLGPIAGAMASLAIGLAPGSSGADDTDIFLTRSSPREGASTPTVLVVLEAPVSARTVQAGGNGLDALHEALFGLLDQFGDVQIATLRAGAATTGGGGTRNDELATGQSADGPASTVLAVDLDGSMRQQLLALVDTPAGETPSAPGNAAPYRAELYWHRPSADASASQRRDRGRAGADCGREFLVVISARRDSRGARPDDPPAGGGNPDAGSGQSTAPARAPIPAHGAPRVIAYIAGSASDRMLLDPSISAWVATLSESGKRQPITTHTGPELIRALSQALNRLLARPASLAAPAVPINAFNPLFNRDEAYLALLRPDTTRRWNGNVKKLNLCPDRRDCVLGELLDRNARPAVGADGRLLDSAQTVWSAVADGLEIESGGAGDRLPPIAGRMLYTDLGLADHPPNPIDLGSAAGDQVLNHANQATNVLFREAICQKTDCDAVLRWMLGGHGANPHDDRRSASADLRWGIPDSLHASPVVVTYGGNEVEPIDKIFVGANDGSLRMLNGSNHATAGGMEEWAFLPGEFLRAQEGLMSNPDGARKHAYGVDLTPRVLTHDLNRDGIIDPSDGDYVWLFAGLRRGGASYYALDVTPASKLTTNRMTPGVPSIIPRFMWRISAGHDDGFGDFTRLSQTWSRPVAGAVSVDDGAGGTETRPVLIFGGGYDPSLDTGYGLAATDGDPNAGNAIYVVDARTGRLIRWISSDPGADIVIDQAPDTRMEHAIPSEISALDTNGDTLLDRLYFGDAGGNVWRIDLGANLGAAPASRDRTVVGKLAALATAGVRADERAIFERPDIVQVRDHTFAAPGQKRHDLVVVATGDRPAPLATDVDDRVYAIRDLAHRPLGRVGASLHLADRRYPRPGGAALTDRDLLDVTGNPIQDATGITRAEALEALRSGRGWYLNLETAPGEKALAAPITLAGKLFVTTFSPVSSSESCAVNEGQGRLYALDLLTGGAALDFDGGRDRPLTRRDRSRLLGAGIPSAALPIFQESGISLLIGGSGGAIRVDPGIDLPRKRTYWLQQ